METKELKDNVLYKIGFLDGMQHIACSFGEPRNALFYIIPVLVVLQIALTSYDILWAALPLNVIVAGLVGYQFGDISRRKKCTDRWGVGMKQIGPPTESKE